MDSRADDYLRIQGQMESRRSNFETQWREVAERVRPNQNFFQQQQRAEGDKRNEKIFDSTAPLALPKFAAAVISMSFPATQMYQRLTTADPDIAERDDVRLYLDAVNTALFRARYAPKSNFQAQTGEVVMDIGAFGTGVLFIDDVPGMGIRYKSFPLAESYIAENGHGVIDTLHRKFEFTANQAATMFGINKLPPAIQAAVEKDPGQKFWFIHCVHPNPNINPARKNYDGMAFTSAYIAMETRHTVDVGGFRTFPFAVPRYETSPREVYGRSPCMQVLPTIKTLNEMTRTILRAAQIAVEPPIMLSDDASLQAFNLRGAALNYGYLGDQGQEKAKPFVSGARVDLGLEMLSSQREIINDALFVTLFRILVEEPQITATEAMLRAQEKGQLLAPTMGRIQTELLGPCTERELDILSMMGNELPPMPQALLDIGGLFHVEYQSPLNLAQRSSAGVGIMNTIQALAPLAQMDPKVMLVFDSTKIARELAEINGVPNKVMRSADEVAAMEQQQDQQAQAQQLLAAAPVAASSAKDFAQAQAMSGGNQQAPAILPGG